METVRSADRGEVRRGLRWGPSLDGEERWIWARGAALRRALSEFTFKCKSAECCYAKAAVLHSKAHDCL